MSKKDRLIEILLKTATPPRDARLNEVEQQEVDTSCPHIPFGFVRTKRFSLSVDQEPDEFWSYAISTDEFLDPLAAKVEALDVVRLESVFTVIRKDLARVGVEGALAQTPGSPIEAFTVERACRHCSGRVLLLRYTGEARYAHWHRES